MNKALKTVLVISAVALPAVIMTYQILSAPSVACEVCMEFRGNTQCRKANGPDRGSCQRTASENACAFLASGMTDSMACAQREPVKISF